MIDRSLLRKPTKSEYDNIVKWFTIHLKRDMNTSKIATWVFFILSGLMFITVISFCFRNMSLFVGILFAILGIATLLAGLSALSFYNRNKRKLSIINRGFFKVADGYISDIVSGYTNGPVGCCVIKFVLNRGCYIGRFSVRKKGVSIGSKAIISVIRVGKKEDITCFTPYMFSKEGITLDV